MRRPWPTSALVRIAQLKSDIGRVFARPAGFAESIMRPPLGAPPSRRLAYAMLRGEGLAARRAEFGLDRVDNTDVIGFPQHAYDLAVTIVRGERSSRVAKCIASIRVDAIGKQLFHNINVTAIRGPHQRRTVDDVTGVAVSVMGKQNFDRYRPVVRRRSHQRGLAVEVPGVDISSVLEKHLHQLGVASFGGKYKRRVAVAVARIHIGSLLKPGYRRLDVPLIGCRDQIIGLLRIIPAHDNPPYRRRSKTPGIYEPTDESEGTISLRVVLRVSFAAHTDNIATTPGSGRLERRDQTSGTHGCIAALHCSVTPDFPNCVIPLGPTMSQGNCPGVPCLPASAE